MKLGTWCWYLSEDPASGKITDVHCRVQWSACSNLRSGVFRHYATCFVLGPLSWFTSWIIIRRGLGLYKHGFRHVNCMEIVKNQVIYTTDTIFILCCFEVTFQCTPCNESKGVTTNHSCNISEAILITIKWADHFGAVTLTRQPDGLLIKHINWCI